MMSFPPVQQLVDNHIGIVDNHIEILTPPNTPDVNVLTPRSEVDEKLSLIHI